MVSYTTSLERSYDVCVYNTMGVVLVTFCANIDMAQSVYVSSSSDILRRKRRLLMWLF